MKTMPWKDNRREGCRARSCRRRRHRWRPSHTQTVASEQTATPSKPAFLTFSSITQRHVYLSLLLPNYRVETEKGVVQVLPNSWRVEWGIWKCYEMSQAISWEMKDKRRNANYVDDWFCKKRFCIYTTIDKLRRSSGHREWNIFPGNIWTNIVSSKHRTVNNTNRHSNTNHPGHFNCLQCTDVNKMCWYNRMFWR